MKVYCNDCKYGKGSSDYCNKILLGKEPYDYEHILPKKLRNEKGGCQDFKDYQWWKVWVKQ